MTCSSNFLIEILEENLKLEEDYTEEQWCDDIDQKLFSFKHKFRVVSRRDFFWKMGCTQQNGECLNGDMKKSLKNHKKTESNKSKNFLTKKLINAG